MKHKLFPRLTALVLALLLMASLLGAAAPPAQVDVGNNIEPLAADDGIAPLAAGHQSQDDVPAGMLDNDILDALEYSGYKVSWLRNNKHLYQWGWFSGDLVGKTTDTGASILSGITYGGDCRGLNTVSDPSTPTGLAPAISKWPAMDCRAFTTYFYFNYLPNILGNAAFNQSSELWSYFSPGYWTVPGWYNGAENAVKADLAIKVGDSMADLSKAKVGDLLIFKNGDKWVHVAVYAGHYANEYYADNPNIGTVDEWMIHVGNSRGPEIAPVSSMENEDEAGNKLSHLAGIYRFRDYEQFGTIEINKTDPDGKPLSGATFRATNMTTGEQTDIGPTDSSGYASRGQLSFATYRVEEITFPDGYTSSGQTSWTVTLNKDTPNGTVTIHAVNRLRTGTLKVIKTTSTGANLSGWQFGVYSDAACTKPVDGSPFTSGTDGTITTALVPGTYYVKELGNRSGWVMDTRVQAVTITADQTSEVTFHNVHMGSLRIVKYTSTNEDLDGWQFRVTDSSGNEVEGSPFTVTRYGGSGRPYAQITQLLLPGNYTVEELVPEGSSYECTSENPQTVTVVAGETASVTFTNTLTSGRIELQKVNTDGSSAAGVQFSLSVGDGLGTTFDLTTDSSGHASASTKAAWRGMDGMYLTLEEQSPDGYVPESITLTVTRADGTPGWISLGEAGTATLDWDGYLEEFQVLGLDGGGKLTITATNRPETGTLKIVKTMLDGSSPAGWQFRVADSSGNEVAGSPFTTGEDGTITVGLAGDTYTVKEIIPENSPYRCASQNPQRVDVFPNATATVTFRNTLRSGVMELQKVNTDGSSAAGVQFTFLFHWDVDDDDPWVVTTDANGYTSIENSDVNGIPFDIIEQSPDGYVPESITLTLVRLDGTPGEIRIGDAVYTGTVTLDWNGTLENVRVQGLDGAGKLIVTATNRPDSGKLSVRKTDLEGNPLAGARFLLQWSEDGTSWQPVVAGSDGAPGSCSSVGLTDGCLTSGEDGMVVFEGLHPTMQYRLTEVEAPQGYALLPEPAFVGTLPAEDLTLTVVNAPQFVLPATGANSLWIVSAVGCLCIALGMIGICIVNYRQKEKNRGR